jgi:signal transduction histidine kinase
LTPLTDLIVRNGEITVRSEPGKETVFTVRIPVVVEV